MASITLSDAAPQEKVHFSLSSVDFDLGPGDTYESDDLAVLSDARTNPWLVVTVKAEEPADVADDTPPTEEPPAPSVVVSDPIEEVAPAPAARTTKGRN